MEFEESLAFVKKVGFSRAHVFAYSVRPGTVAARAEGQIPGGEKARRSRAMIAACDLLRDAYLDRWVGRETEVLLETRAGGGRLEGYTPTYFSALVSAPEDAAVPGDAVQVRITGHKDGVCDAVLV